MELTYIMEQSHMQLVYLLALKKFDHICDKI